jgi:hypothetical protein
MGARSALYGTITFAARASCGWAAGSMQEIGTHSDPDHTWPQPCTSGPLAGSAAGLGWLASGGSAGREGTTGGLATGGGGSGSALRPRDPGDPVAAGAVVEAVLRFDRDSSWWHPAASAGTARARRTEARDISPG